MKTLIIRAGIPILVLLLSGFLGCASVGKEDRLKQASAHYQLGISYLGDNNIQPAFVEFQKALELNPEDKEVLNAIGVIYLLKLEDAPKAMDYFKKALAIDRRFAEASNNLGVAYEKIRRYDDAIAAYREALSNPLYKFAQKAFNNMGRAQYRSGRYEAAVGSFKEALRRSSDFHLPYYGLALAYNAMGRYSDAATALKKGLELDPEYKGDREKAANGLKEKKLLARGEEEKDLEDLLEIMNY